MTTQNKAIVMGREQVEESYIKKTGRFLFFKTEWWEMVATGHIANDILIETQRPIRHVYLNGKLLSEQENGR